ncbi:MAG: hypothetical protein OXE55_06640 [Flavobacteriaceae bacterium]|nr:hypothetical protein [Flavobacteriaceae bacterium]
MKPQKIIHHQERYIVAINFYEPFPYSLFKIKKFTTDKGYFNCFFGSVTNQGWKESHDLQLQEFIKKETNFSVFNAKSGVHEYNLEPLSEYSYVEPINPKNSIFIKGRFTQQDIAYHSVAEFAEQRRFRIEESIRKKLERYSITIDFKPKPHSLLIRDYKKTVNAICDDMINQVLTKNQF